MLTQLAGVGATGGGHRALLPPEEELLEEEPPDEELLDEEPPDEELLDEPLLTGEPPDEGSPEPPHAASNASTPAAAAREYTRPRRVMAVEKF